MKKIILFVIFILLILTILPKDLALVKSQDLILEYSDWIVKVEKETIQIKDNQLYIKLKFYPPYFSKIFPKRYVQVIDKNSTEFINNYSKMVDKNNEPYNIDNFNNWLNTLPKVYILNSAFSVMVKVSSNIDDNMLLEYINKTYTPEILNTIDNYLTYENPEHYISPFMKNKTTIATEMVDKSILPIIKNKIITDNISIKFSQSDILNIQPKSIYVGSPAIDRASGLSIANYTLMPVNQVSDGTGILDTARFYLYLAGDNVSVGTATFSGSNASTNDSQYLGSVNYGSEDIITGLSINVLVGDRAEISSTSGGTEYIKRGTDSNEMYYNNSGSRFIPHSSLSFNLSTGTISLNLTGETITGETIQFIPKIIFIN